LHLPLTGLLLLSLPTMPALGASLLSATPAAGFTCLRLALSSLLHLLTGIALGVRPLETFFPTVLSAAALAAAAGLFCTILIGASR
jgi:hypothetical protein